MTIELHTWNTPNGRKISVALEEMGLSYNVHPVNISKNEQFAPDFLKISPNNRIPAIIDTDGPGGTPISVFESGAIPVARLSIGGVGLTNDRLYLVALAVIFSLFGLLVVALRRSRFGRALIAMRESQAGSETLGMRTTALKLGVFTLSAGIAGVGWPATFVVSPTSTVSSDVAARSW